MEKYSYMYLKVLWIYNSRSWGINGWINTNPINFYVPISSNRSGKRVLVFSETEFDFAYFYFRHSLYCSKTYICGLYQLLKARFTPIFYVQEEQSKFQIVCLCVYNWMQRPNSVARVWSSRCSPFSISKNKYLHLI